MSRFVSTFALIALFFPSMIAHERLTTLKKAAEKAITQGWLPFNGVFKGVDTVFDPPSIAITYQPPDGYGDAACYFDPGFPLFERAFAISFFGTQLTGDILFGYLPAWQYHQHKLLSFLQQDDWETYFNYLDLYLG